MASGKFLLRFVPDDPDDEKVIVSKKKLDQWLKEQEEEMARLRQEIEELKRRLHVHENPNVPPSVRNHAPGYTRARPIVPSDRRKKLGAKPGHEGVTREPLTPDEKGNNLNSGGIYPLRCEGGRLFSEEIG